MKFQFNPFRHNNSALVEPAYYFGLPIIEVILFIINSGLRRARDLISTMVIKVGFWYVNTPKYACLPLFLLSYNIYLIMCVSLLLFYAISGHIDSIWELDSLVYSGFIRIDCSRRNLLWISCLGYYSSLRAWVSRQDKAMIPVSLVLKSILSVAKIIV